MLKNILNSVKVKWQGPVFDFLERHRGLLIVIFCLPASFIFNLFLQLRLRLRSSESADGHGRRVREIQTQVRQWNDLPQSKRKLLCTARPNWLSLSTTFFKKDECHQVPIPLYSILNLDEKNKTVRVEPLVTVGQITKYLIPKGYTLAVTLEIGDATLGGLAMGTGMTTYSHKQQLAFLLLLLLEIISCTVYKFTKIKRVGRIVERNGRRKVGLYQEAIEAMEIISGDGSLFRATRDNEHSDLFNCLPWSHGSLGFLVALELKIIKVKPYVHMTYIPVHGQKNYCDKIREISGALDKDKETPDFVEATVFSKEEAVIMVGKFSNVRSFSDREKINHLSLWYKPWFYKHVESFLEKGQSTEFIPLRDYLLRHNRAIFWVVESMIPFGNHPIFRFLLGWLLPPKPAFLKFTTTPGVRAMTFTKQVFQDIVLPMNKLEEQINISERLFDTYPILLYPCRIYDHGEHKGQLRPPREDQLCPGADWGMFNDIGIYGVPGPVQRKENYDAVGTMREMEQFTRDVGGYSFLYADIFMNREEFEEMFDLTLYEVVRKKYHAHGAFPHLYDKIKPEIDVFEVGRKYASTNSH